MIHQGWRPPGRREAHKMTKMFWILEIITYIVFFSLLKGFLVNIFSRLLKQILEMLYFEQSPNRELPMAVFPTGPHLSEFKSVR